MYYVTMTDRFMSGWGYAENKTNKMVVACKDLHDARIIEKNAQKRSEMKYINICSKKPYYNKDLYYTSYKSFEDLGNVWKKE